MAGEEGNFDFNLHSLRQIKYLGVTFRTSSLDEVRIISERAVSDLWPAVTEGRLRLPVDKSYDLLDVSNALAAMRSNSHFGKIVLIP